ncbi:uncharacterized protein MYCFIDRAFT_88010 [Pseudocercospora fijiensis CIRAD86]|uniref:F-box domain-containing protein n=1 Tax=Pseudocercospora fijiensis (strain CIRAD86) TaxID=383855 RepID=M2YUA5_PSEFD|nr:uncharacterized protein MYCFIDRAFT_88010 [Pseudocercospora fijiensis CIRAD86]EME81300.1 hypothetical protein MYCFIDRAFT_88010 [Pseudocercospora fijiensis CIRAD86]
MARLKFTLLHSINKVKAMNTPFAFRLLDLPNELVSTIIEHVESVAILKTLCRTCRRLQYLTEPVLYRYALIRTGVETEFIHGAITHHTRGRDRAAALEKIDIPCHPRFHQNFQEVARILAAVSNLKELMIESPECNTSDFESEAEWQQMVGSLFRPFRDALSGIITERLPLQKLQKLTLHINGSDSPYWTLDQWSVCLFLLPSLVFLKVSCINLLHDIPGGPTSKAICPLRHLELEEANITHTGLRYILGLPRALEILYLGENCYNIRHFGEEVDPTSNHLFTSDSAASVEALKQQSHSLKQLTYATTDKYYQHRQRRLTNRNKGPTDAGFADFHCLESVTLIGYCPNFERAIMSSRSPPILKNLTFKSDNAFRPGSYGEAESTFSMIPFLRAPSSSVPPTLANLNVVYHNPPLSPQDLTPSTRIFIETAAKATGKVGINLRVLSEDRTNYFPPYLYGEPTPEEHVVYDGDFTQSFASIGAKASSRVILWGPIED